MKYFVIYCGLATLREWRMRSLWKGCTWVNLRVSIVEADHLEDGKIGCGSTWMREVWEWGELVFRIFTLPLTFNTGKWLTDEHINLAQECLRHQYPEIDGLQDSILFTVPKFVRRITGSKFVQILHINGNHWVCVTSIGCSPGEVKIYDSMTPSAQSKC